MTSMQHWTPEQWAVFTATLAAGLLAAVVVALLRRARWTPPALLRARGPAPRPTIVRTVQRRAISNGLTPSDIAFNERSAGQIELLRAWARNNPPAWTDPAEADYTDPGIGALSSIQAVTVDPTLRTQAEIDAELEAWVNAYADLSGLMPETDAAAETMRVNLEPALRTARLWRVRGEGGPARQALTDWRIDTPTGEYPMLTTADLRPYAAALLVS